MDREQKNFVVKLLEVFKVLELSLWVNLLLASPR